MKINSENVSSEFRETLESIGSKLATFFTAIILFFLFPIILIISIPQFIFRFFVGSFLKTWIRPDLGSMVTGRGTIFAIDPKYTRPKNSIITRLIWEGTMDLKEIRQRVQERMINQEDDKYPELKQHLVQWMGFFFWKDDEHFDLDIHVNLLNKEGDTKVYSDKDINGVMKDLLQKPWVEGRPLWEIVLVQNCQLNLGGSAAGTSQTVLFLRVHHTLADGYAILSLLYEGLIGIDISNPAPQYHNRADIFQSISYVLGFPFRCAFEMAESLIVPLLPWAPLAFSSVVTKQTGEFFMDTSSKIPLQEIREVRKRFSVSFSSVLLTAVSGALRDIMIKKDMIPPKMFPIILPMPFPGHPDQLVNYWGYGVVKLPLGEPDALKRLEFCNKEYQRLKSSTIYVFSKFYILWIGLYFTPIVRFLLNNTSSLTMLSNFPGGLKPAVMLGHSLVDVTFIQGPVGDSALAMCALSFIDGFRILPIADSSVMSKDDVTEFTILIQKHFQILLTKIDQ